jgi:hypothetical protein
VKKQRSVVNLLLETDLVLRWWWWFRGGRGEGKEGGGKEGGGERGEGRGLRREESEREWTGKRGRVGRNERRWGGVRGDGTGKRGRVGRSERRRGRSEREWDWEERESGEE